MNIFGFLVVFFCLLAEVSAKCADSCECPEFSSLRYERYDVSYLQFTQLAGCAANATCVNPNNFMMLSGFSSSEIEHPPETPDNFFIVTSGRNSSILASSFDLFPYFGIICEGGSWYATKYPMGIATQSVTGGGLIYTNYDESYDGKKSRISVLAW
ncbi:Protein CBG22440 [Caenorhabditis briggsae]|uniref:Protein CBG22440 n=2 Tax=Caenorhabditis briggsae TaxID=6238 RepID=A8Y2A6_CAEBR|nr:Protein CBG22440 [Caenorhabditis briggsae]ULT86890.1 hypothetical protein L3Y34_006551 [Caenorhabditis briggsae]CAP39026.1 Protein CBG22440 [Caenorhabditis briggsae]